ncbi:MAG: hypothetical protein LBI49_25260 [Nocardiopsaceae bacterium]|jgi:hypothetical protein|nr:hypothetical protein [Nocardiopsaceae bacterium]
MTAERLPDRTVLTPLAAFTGATRIAVQGMLGVGDPAADYTGIALLSGHLAAMGVTVYPRAAAGQPGADRQLRAACLGQVRSVAWALRLLECQLSGEARAAALPASAPLAALALRLGSYWQVERALVSWLEQRLADDEREDLADRYRRALDRAPTRPHPWCPRSWPLRHVAFWLHGRWDRVLDTVDARPGAGRRLLS